MHFDTVATPDGPFTVVVKDGLVLASGWTDDAAYLLETVHPSLRDGTLTRDTVATAFATAAVTAYYAGDFTAPARVPVAQHSGQFRMRAWQCLREVVPGRPVSYSELAALAGNPRAVRAAASSCAHNAAPLFVPCHRVIAKDGGIGGFLYGTDLKQRLLDRETAA